MGVWGGRGGGKRWVEEGKEEKGNRRGWNGNNFKYLCVSFVF